MRLDSIDAGPAHMERGAANAGFIATPVKRPHPPRRRAILAAHPEAASLIGHDRRTAAITLAVVVGQTSIAALLGYLGPRLLVASLGRRLLHRRLRQSRNVRRHSRRLTIIASSNPMS